jgi:hypothetical protein
MNSDPQTLANLVIMGFVISLSGRFAVGGKWHHSKRK